MSQLPNSIPRSNIEGSLLSKSFKLEKEKDHRYYNLYYKGKRQKIRTKISTGSKYQDYGIDLLNQMKRQLKLNLRDTKLLLICPMTGSKYIELLISKGEISDP